MALMMVGCLPMQVPSIRMVSSPLSFSHSVATSLSYSSSSLSLSSSPSLPLVYCGRGDKKTAKGKRFNHSFGNARPRNKKKGRGPPRIAVPPSPSAPKKGRPDDNELIKIEIDESLFSDDGWRGGQVQFPERSHNCGELAICGEGTALNQGVACQRNVAYLQP